MRFAALFATLLFAALACGGDTERTDENAAIGGTSPSGSDVAGSYAPELAVELAAMRRTEAGLYVQDVQEGTGEELREGQNAVVHYTGYLPDGTKFDSSLDRNEPFTVAVGQGQVIDGWELGLPGMKVGGRRRLVIPPHLAYGDAGAGGVVPPGATLVFDVELLAIR